MRQRKSSSKKQMENDLMGAQMVSELYPNAPSWRSALGLTGKYEMPSMSEIAFSGFMELVGSFLLAIIVTLVRAVASTGNPILDGLLVGVAYAGTYYFVQMWPKVHALRRHLNWGVSLLYWMLNEIGLLGFLFYGSIQLLGAFLGGWFVGGLPIIPGGIATPVAGAAAIAASTVPAPLSTITNFGYALGLEFLGGFIILFALAAGEFYATDMETLEKNHERGVTLATAATLVLCTAFYSVQSYTYNQVVYWGGLFAGTNQAGLRAVAASASFSTNEATLSVLSGGAWALYTFMILLSAVAAGLVMLFLLWLKNARGLVISGRFRVGPRGADASMDIEEEKAQISSYLQHVAPAAAIQTRVTDLQHPYRRM